MYGRHLRFSVYRLPSTAARYGNPFHRAFGDALLQSAQIDDEHVKHLVSFIRERAADLRDRAWQGTAETLAI